MTEHNYSTRPEKQRERLLARLQSSPLSTLQARQELDIMHPAARVKELREQGYNIITHRVTGDTGKASHSVACYALLQGEQQ